MPASMTSAQASGGSKNGVILTGALRDVYSQEILFNSQPSLLHAQFVDQRTELGRERGDSIKFLKYADLRGSARLSEVETIQPTHLSANLVGIEVDEYGFAVQESERLIRTSWDDVMGRAAVLLGQHYGRTVDALCRDEFLAAAALQTYFPTGVAGRAAIAAANTLDAKAIKDAVERLAVNKAPKINGAYVSIIHPHQARGLRDSAFWLDAHKYAAPENIFMGEIGMLEGVRFIETTNTAVVQAATGVVYEDGNPTDTTEAVFSATADVYRALVLGANAVGWAVGLPVEFRDNGIQDFSRTRALGWYSIMGAGQIRPENVVGIETA